VKASTKALCIALVAVWVLPVEWNAETQPPGVALAPATGARTAFAAASPGDASNPQPADETQVLDHFPLHIGTQWSYRNISKSAVDTAGSIFTVRWRSRVMIAEHVQTPQGLLVRRRLEIQDVKYDYPPDTRADTVAGIKASLPERGIAQYLIRGNSVFEVDGPADGQTESDWIQSLDRDWDDVCPAFVFPLTADSHWSERTREEKDRQQALAFQEGKGNAPNPVMYYWIVDGTEDLNLPIGKVPGTVRLIYRALGGPLQVWFKDGIGVVKTSFVHHGSFGEEESVLDEFLPATH
jgi:hypothetical protein